jgi:hypothetical protein
MYAENVLSNLALTAAAGKIRTCQCVLSVTTALSGGLSYKTLTLPDWAHGFRIYPTVDTRFAIDEMPIFTTATFVVGGIATASLWTTKYIPDGIARTLQMVVAATGTVTVEVF